MLSPLGASLSIAVIGLQFFCIVRAGVDYFDPNLGGGSMLNVDGESNLRCKLHPELTCLVLRSKAHTRLGEPLNVTKDILL